LQARSVRSRHALREELLRVIAHDLVPDVTPVGVTIRFLSDCPNQLAGDPSSGIIRAEWRFLPLLQCLL
jgi:hypothetical protein